MAGPWEKYQSAPAPAPTAGSPAGPWTRYAPAAPVAQQDFRGEGGGRGTGLEAALIGARQGVTLGFGDEINAAARAAGDWFGGKPFGEAYDERLAHERGLLEQTRRENPVTSTAGEIGGAVAPALLTGGASLPTTAAAAGRGALVGGATGAAYGFGEGEGGFDARTDSALKGAALGAGAGAIAGGVGHKLAARSAGKAAQKAALEAGDLPAGTSDDFMARGADLYEKATASPKQFTAADIAGLRAEVVDALKGTRDISRTGRNISGASRRALREIDMLGREIGDGAANVEDLLGLRQMASDLAKSPDSASRRVGGAITRKVDDFLNKAGVPELAEGAKNFAAGFKQKAIENIREAAAQGRDERVMFRTLYSQIKRGSSRGWTPEEIEAIKKAATGGNTRAALDFLGKHANVGGQLVGAAVGASTGGPVGALAGGLAARTAGAGLRGAAANVTAKQGQAVSDAIMRRLIKQAQAGAVPTSDVAPALSAWLAERGLNRE